MAVLVERNDCTINMQLLWEQSVVLSISHGGYFIASLIILKRISLHESMTLNKLNNNYTRHQHTISYYCIISLS